MKPSPNADSGRVITLVPGDHVRFDDKEWEVLIAPREQHPDSVIWVFRYPTPGRAGPVDDVMRWRCELDLIPRPLPPNGSSEAAQ